MSPRSRTDPATRQERIDAVAAEVKQVLGGGDDGGFIGDVVCGFNRERQFPEQVVMLIGTPLVEDDDASNTFRLSSTDPDPLALPGGISLFRPGEPQRWDLAVIRRFLARP